MFYKMRGKTIISTEYFFQHGKESASILKITFSDGTSAFIEAYITNDDAEEYAVITVNKV